MKYIPIHNERKYIKSYKNIYLFPYTHKNFQNNRNWKLNCLANSVLLKYFTRYGNNKNNFCRETKSNMSLLAWNCSKSFRAMLTSSFGNMVPYLFLSCCMIWSTFDWKIYSCFPIPILIFDAPVLTNSLDPHWCVLFCMYCRGLPWKFLYWSSVWIAYNNF